MNPPTQYLLGVEHPIFPATAVYLPDGEYDRATSAFVRVCADVVLYVPAEKSIYLAKRIIPPECWWMLGGKMNPGESEIDAAMRHVRNDTGLAIDAKKFQLLRLNRYLYVGSKGASQDSFAFTFAVACELGEIEKVQLRSDEYDSHTGIQQFRKPELGTYGVPKPIMDIYNQIFP